MRLTENRTEASVLPKLRFQLMLLFCTCYKASLGREHTGRAGNE